MMVSPMHVEIALHYHCISEQHPDLHIPAYEECARDLENGGLLRSLPRGGYEASDGLAVWIEAICSTPFPALKWVMPN